ncbi:class I SAM-dependent methyltransferase [Chitinophaga vietnamensis]|uniref:class I SAM-dependent methyltransferase n=1 Tax=Chitinophaga vietnamensis TaxID=2593957 RepID=UPI001177B80E|nr:class I SAM-dependent methyltransferase [Chitinophaga vietnamensis]
MNREEDYKRKWEERYQEATYAFGKAPNEFFREWLPEFAPGAILMPADGEGRNGVYAAQLGWDVTAFDLSITGQAKALQLARERNVSIDYIVGDLAQLSFDDARFDAIGLIYAHFAAEKKSLFHHKLDACLRPGGIILLEAFSKRHLDYRRAHPEVGGPTEIDMLYSREELLSDFSNYDILLLEDTDVWLDEGESHIGKGAVIRFAGRKMA